MLTKTNYLQMIAAADGADVLHALRQDIKNDPTLFSTDKDELCDAIFKRFAELNAAELPPEDQKPRWQLEGGTWDGKSVAAKFRRAVAENRVRGCKHLIVILFCALLGTATTFADSAPDRPALVPTAIGQTVGGSGANRSLLFVRRLAALSQIESGDDDNAIGRAGEVSRFQILPAVWRAYASHHGVMLDPRNPFTAWNIARFILQDRCKAFAARFHRPPTDQEFYVLWARPSWVMDLSRRGRLPVTLSPPAFHHHRVMERALRFSNLVNR